MIMSDELSADISWLLQRFIVNWPKMKDEIFHNIIGKYDAKLGQPGIWKEIENKMQRELSYYNTSYHSKSISEDEMMDKCYGRLEFWYNHQEIKIKE